MTQLNFFLRRQMALITKIKVKFGDSELFIANIRVGVCKILICMDREFNCAQHTCVLEEMDHRYMSCAGIRKRRSVWTKTINTKSGCFPCILFHCNN